MKEASWSAPRQVAVESGAVNVGIIRVIAGPHTETSWMSTGKHH